MPRLIGVREQLGEFARPYPYPPIRQPVPLGEFARPYPYPYIRQPVPLGSFLDDSYDYITGKAKDAYNYVTGKAEDLSQWTVDLAGSRICSKEANDELMKILNLRGRYYNYLRASREAARTAPANLRSKAESVVAQWEFLIGEMTKVIDKTNFWQTEAYKLGVSGCTTNVRGVRGVGSLAYGVNYGVGEPVTIATGTIVALGVIFVVGVTLIATIILFREKAEIEGANVKAQADALKDAIEVTRAACTSDPSGKACADARQFQREVANMSNKGFADYANLEQKREEAGMGQTIQTVAIAGVVGLIAFYGLKILASRQKD